MQSNMYQNVTINNVVFKPRNPFAINIKALHNDPKQWKEPKKFVPERFDPQSEWYKKPDGGMRNPLTFCPFLGGKRICIGKTFAEITIRFTVSMLYHHFDFQFTEETLANRVPLC